MRLLAAAGVSELLVRIMVIHEGKKQAEGSEEEAPAVVEKVCCAIAQVGVRVRFDITWAP
jgi:hypothetical protein